MLRNKMIAFALCAALGVLLAGCGDETKKDVSSTVSRVESGMEEAGSRVGSAVESALDPDESREPSPSPQAR